MKLRIEILDPVVAWVRHYVSPVFLAMLVASFILWYIAKLSYVYTTEQSIPVQIDDRKYNIPCVVEGVGTNLFGYQAYMRKRIHIKRSELKYSCAENEEGRSVLVIDPQSLQNAISVHYSDIKILSIVHIPEIEAVEECETE